MDEACGSRSRDDCRCTTASQHTAPACHRTLADVSISLLLPLTPRLRRSVLLFAESKSVRFLCFDLSNLSHPVLFALLSGGGEMHWPITAPRAVAQAD